MKLYKFKSLRNTKHILDIIKHKRFYAAKFLELNDPMEGAFTVIGEDGVTLKDRIVEAKQQWRICSFSKEYDVPLLWAHYADGFQGICFEIEIDEACWRENMRSVTYSEFDHVISRNTFDLSDIKNILSRKIPAWEYEEEVRVLTQSDFIFENIEIRAILLGMRISPDMEWMLKRLNVQNLRIIKTKIENERILSC